MISSIPLEELPMTRALLKLAELPEPPPDSGEAPQQGLEQPPPIKHPILHGLKAVMMPAAAFGAGTVAGSLAQRGVSKVIGLRPSAEPIMRRYVVPVIGGLGALAYQQYKSREQKELKRALEAHNSRAAGKVPAE